MPNFNFRVRKLKFTLTVFAVMVASSLSCRQEIESNRHISNLRGVGNNHHELGFSTYIGGSNGDGVRDVATDRAGYIYLAGGTESSDFPVTPGAYDTSHNGGSDVFVTKMDPRGKILWSTFIGGPSHDRAYAVEVDDRGYVYIAGRAGTGFPVTPGAFQTSFSGGPSKGPYPAQDGFVAKLSLDGKRLVFASYFGAEDDPAHPVRDLAVDSKGDIYLAASSSTGAYPKEVLAAFQKGFLSVRQGDKDGVVAKIKADGSRVIWATYLGGSREEWGEGSIRVDGAGNVYFLTVTNSPDIRTTEGAYDRTYNGGWDFYLAKLSSEGSLIYGTYLGGSGNEHVETHELAVDAQGNAIVASGTTSADFPITGVPFQRTYRGSGGKGTGLRTNYPGDVIVAKISADGSRLLASTFIGGQFGEAAEGVGLDGDGNVCLSGATFSDNFPVTRNAFQSKKKGKLDAFAVKLSADFSLLLYSTYMGGSGLNAGRTATVDADGNCYIGGEVNSQDWPTRAAMQPVYGQQGDGFLSRFALRGNSHRTK